MMEELRCLTMGFRFRSVAFVMAHLNMRIPLAVFVFMVGNYSNQTSKHISHSDNRFI